MHQSIRIEKTILHAKSKMAQNAGATRFLLFTSLNCKTHVEFRVLHSKHLLSWFQIQEDERFQSNSLTTNGSKTVKKNKSTVNKLLFIILWSHNAAKFLRMYKITGFTSHSFWEKRLNPTVARADNIKSKSSWPLSLLKWKQQKRLQNHKRQQNHILRLSILFHFWNNSPDLITTASTMHFLIEFKK